MPAAPVIEQSVAAMMRRGLTPMESHLILASARYGFGNRSGDEPARR
jgi:hypothetical protein